MDNAALSQPERAPVALRTPSMLVVLHPCPHTPCSAPGSAPNAAHHRASAACLAPKRPSVHTTNSQLPTPPRPSHSLPQASHFVIMMVKKYPYCRIINFDKLDYCSCLKNLDGIKESPNYK